MFPPPHTTVLRARLVLPVSQPPLENGLVIIGQGRIQRLAPWLAADLPAGTKVLDLGECVVLPGLVNAHCHLDYTDLAGRLPPPASFTDWIQALIALKKSWLPIDFQRSWRHGAAMLLRHGVTTVANIETQPVGAAPWEREVPLRIFPFLELIGFQSDRPPDRVLGEALAWLHHLNPPRGNAGWSPHAPYTTSPDLLRRIARAALEHDVRLTMHVAESREEFDMLRHQRGPLYDWLKDRRDMSDCGRHSPVAHLHHCGLLSDRMLAVHVNYLAEDDAPQLGQNRVSVAHCPRSHAYFGHDEFPLAALTDAAVNICLGTDSLATVAPSPAESLELDPFAEMRAFAASHPQVSPEATVKMATLNGARALGLTRRAGELAEQSWADLILIPYAGPIQEVYEAVVNFCGEVRGTMINGDWAIDPEII